MEIQDPKEIYYRMSTRLRIGLIMAVITALVVAGALVYIASMDIGWWRAVKGFAVITALLTWFTSMMYCLDGKCY